MRMKTCTKCSETKSLEKFSKNSRNKTDGRQPKCKNCNREYRESNRGKILSYLKNYYEEKGKYLDRTEYLTKYRLEHKEEVRAYKSLYCKINRGKINSETAERRAAKKKATPDWLTKGHKKEIKIFYWLASDLYKTSGETYDVDHIVPLGGENVCGLHVPWNLQVLPSDINRSKSNNHNDWNNLEP